MANILSTENFDYKGHRYTIDLLTDCDNTQGYNFAFGVQLKVDGVWVQAEVLPRGISGFKRKRKEFRKTAQIIIRSKLREYVTN